MHRHGSRARSRLHADPRHGAEDARRPGSRQGQRADHLHGARLAAGGKDSTKIGNFTAPQVQAQALVKAYTMGIAQGVECIQWFEGMDGDSGPMGLLDDKGETRPAYTALGQMIKHLGQHPTYLGWVLLNDKHYGFVFQGARGTVLATWAATSRNRQRRVRPGGADRRIR